MQGEGIDIGVLTKHRCSPIPLMNVEVNDDDFLNSVLVLRHASRDGDVVDDTKTFSRIAKRVVRAAREVRGVGVPTSQDVSRRFYRSSRYSPCTLDESIAEREANRADFLGRQLTLCESTDVLWAVREFNLGSRRERWLAELELLPVSNATCGGEESRLNTTVPLHRKRMLNRQGESIVGVGVDWKAAERG